MPLTNRYLLAAYHTTTGEHKGYYTNRGTLTNNVARADWCVSEKGAEEEIERLKLRTATGFKDYLWCAELVTPQQLAEAGASSETTADTPVAKPVAKPVSVASDKVDKPRRTRVQSAAVTTAKSSEEGGGVNATAMKPSRPSSQLEQQLTVPGAEESPETAATTQPTPLTPAQQKIAELKARATATPKSGVRGGRPRKDADRAAAVTMATKPFASETTAKRGYRPLSRQQRGVPKVSARELSKKLGTRVEVDSLGRVKTPKLNRKKQLKDAQNARYLARKREQIAKLSPEEDVKRRQKRRQSLRASSKRHQRKVAARKVGKKPAPGSGLAGSRGGIYARERQHPCLCGCGKKTEKYFIRGHISRYKGYLLLIAEGEAKPSRYFTKAQIEKLGPWTPTRYGGLRPKHDYTVLREI